MLPPPRLAQRAEKCGIMDQLASAAAVADHALLIDCRTFDRRAVSLPADSTVLVINSGVRHANASGDSTGAAPNATVPPNIMVLWRCATSMRRRSRRNGATSTTSLSGVPGMSSENARVLAAAEALETGDLPAPGGLLATSHRSMRGDFGITVPATDCIVALADEVIAGQGGARVTGGGFGGSVVALVPAAAADAAGAHVQRHYVAPDGSLPVVSTYKAAGRAARLR